MRCIKSIFIVFGLLGASQFIYGDDHGSQMQAPIPVEFWVCEYKEGMGAVDLEPVIKEWKKTMGKRDYEAWMLTPSYARNGAMNNMVMFTGWWPSFSKMGEEVEYAMEKVNPKMDPKWNEVITCAIHAEATAVQTRNGMDTSLDSGVMSYAGCRLKEGKTVPELMQAHAKMSKFMDKIGINKVSSAVLFPGVGAGNDYDYTITTWAPGMKVLGETFETAIANGVAQAVSEVFGDVGECDNGARFVGKRIY